MLGRIAACAAIILVWPICTHASDADGLSLLSETIIASGPQPARSGESESAAADVQTALSEDVVLVDGSERLAAGANASSASQNAVAALRIECRAGPGG
jgi:hypothetical protein